MRILMGDKVVYEGPSVPVPRAGEHVLVEGEARPVEAVTWELSVDNVSVTLLLAERAYAY